MEIFYVEFISVRPILHGMISILFSSFVELIVYINGVEFRLCIYIVP
jgi:hypothetical protein